MFLGERLQGLEPGGHTPVEFPEILEDRPLVFGVGARAEEVGDLRQRQPVRAALEVIDVQLDPRVDGLGQDAVEHRDGLARTHQPAVHGRAVGLAIADRFAELVDANRDLVGEVVERSAPTERPLRHRHRPQRPTVHHHPQSSGVRIIARCFRQPHTLQAALQRPCEARPALDHHLHVAPGGEIDDRLPARAGSSRRLDYSGLRASLLHRADGDQRRNDEIDRHRRSGRGLDPEGIDKGPRRLVPADPAQQRTDDASCDHQLCVGDQRRNREVPGRSSDGRQHDTEGEQQV